MNQFFEPLGGNEDVPREYDAKRESGALRDQPIDHSTVANDRHLPSCGRRDLGSGVDAEPMQDGGCYIGRGTFTVGRLATMLVRRTMHKAGLEASAYKQHAHGTRVCRTHRSR